ncbi:MAG: hypothetical protein ACREN8_01435 [Candidatus Dormibacteraceae bacterium]
MARVLTSPRILPAVLMAALAFATVSCSPSSPASSGGMSQSSPDMHMGDPNGGLAMSEQGYTFDSSSSSLPVNGNQEYRFRILSPTGKPQTSFAIDQTQLMHFYVVRADLTNYQHLHPELASDGTWSTHLPPSAPGPYRVYASFIARDSSNKEHELVLSRELTVPGTYQSVALPAANSTTEVDGYTVALQGQQVSGMGMPFTVHITRRGQPVTNLQPYLGTYAHLTAFRSGNLAFAHLHPEQTARSGKGGGPDLTFHAQLPAAGDYRLFLQFQTEGQLHTAAITVHAG